MIETLLSSVQHPSILRLSGACFHPSVWSILVLFNWPDVWLASTYNINKCFTTTTIQMTPYSLILISVYLFNNNAGWCEQLKLEEICNCNAWCTRSCVIPISRLVISFFVVKLKDYMLRNLLKNIQTTHLSCLLKADAVISVVPTLWIDLAPLRSEGQGPAHYSLTYNPCTELFLSIRKVDETCKGQSSSRHTASCLIGFGHPAIYATNRQAL